MDHESDKIHVMPVANTWEVETQSGHALTREATVEQAVNAARVLAHERGIETVILHDGDGVTEEVPVAKPTSNEQSNIKQS